MLTGYLQIWKDFNNRCIRLDNTFERLIDRDDWKYDLNLLKKGYYRDAHLPKPFHNPQNKMIIHQLLKDANIEELL